MRRGHFLFESTLIAISLLMGLIVLVDENNFYLPALWFIALGALQVLHSIFLAINYWGNSAIRKAICWYWVGVTLDFIVLFLNRGASEHKYIFLTTILIFPCFLALCLWFITYRYQLSSENVEENVSPGQN